MKCCTGSGPLLKRDPSWQRLQKKFSPRSKSLPGPEASPVNLCLWDPPLDPPGWQETMIWTYSWPFPKKLTLVEALALAREVAPVHEEKYAEHAYVHAKINGFEADLVPCYLLEDATRIRSAVDRTPFHTQYVFGRIKGLEDEVLLLKQFMKGVGVYGSELKMGGFSGYLAELLILHYGSFLSVLESASSWRPGEMIDLEAHATISHEDPLVVVDPVDPGRNVAAALSVDRMFQFAAAARCFLCNPSIEFFFPQGPDPISDHDLSKQIRKRGSMFLLLDFEAPLMVEDVIFPQLRKAEESIHALFQRNGFSVLRSDVDCHVVGGDQPGQDAV